MSIFFGGFPNSLFVLDIYIAMVSSTHNVCAKDVYVAIVSTVVETDRPEQEITPGLQLLGPIYEKYETAFRQNSIAHIRIQIRLGYTHLYPDLKWHG